MKLEQSFEVQAPIDRVWGALIDVERVAPCLPGAEITEATDDGKYHGNFTVKLGPTTAAYRGELEMESVDESTRTVTMRASGQDKRGQGGAKATIVSVLREDGGATTIDVDTDFTITGRLARFGRGGMIKDISNRLLKDFSACLTETIESAPGEQESVTLEDPGPSGAPVRNDAQAHASPAPSGPGRPRRGRSR
ncbi:MAG: SRPBCC family protein [Thermoleophilaceae bacterium]